MTDICETCRHRNTRACKIHPCGGLPLKHCSIYDEEDLPFDELTHLKIDHARLTEAYLALREKYREAFPGPCQRKTVESYDVAFFPYPPEWDALQEYISELERKVSVADGSVGDAPCKKGR